MSAPPLPPGGGGGPSGPEVGTLPPEPLLRIRPMGLGEILDDIFRVYRRHFLLLTGISLILSVPPLLLQFASGTAGQLGFFFTLFSNLGRPVSVVDQQLPPPPNPGLIALAYLMVILVAPFTVGAISRAGIDLALARPVSIRSAFGGVLRRYLGLFAMSLLFVLVAIGFVAALTVVIAAMALAIREIVAVIFLSVVVVALAVVAGIFLAVRWSVAVPAMLAEGLGPIRAIGRSWALTRGSWWRLFGTLIVLYLLQSVIGSALGIFAFPVAFLVPFVEPAVRGAIALTISTAAQAVTLPIVYLCFVLLYFDLRVRREDFDLDQLALQAAAGAAV